MRRVILIFIFSSLIGMFTGRQHAHAQEINYKLASLYIYNFTKYVEWPAADLQKGQFVIGVMGNSPIYDELLKMAATKKEVNGRTIVIQKISTEKEAAQCQIVFISSSQSGQVKTLKENLKDHRILFITEKPGMARKGAGINLFIDEDDDNKLKFELNKTSIEQAGLHVSSQLVNLGILVK